MAAGEPDFFNITNSRNGVSYVGTKGIHLQKVFRYELDSTFIKSKRMSEMTRICYRSGFGNMHISLDETQRRHRFPGQRQLRELMYDEGN